MPKSNHQAMKSSTRLILCLAILIAGGGIALVRHITRAIHDQEGVAGIELQYPEKINLHAMQLTFAANAHAGAMDFYTWDGTQWQKQASRRGNRDSKVLLSTISGVPITTSRIRLVFSNPYIYPLVRLVGAVPLTDHPNTIPVPEAHIYGTYSPVNVPAAQLAEILKPSAGIPFYTERFTVYPRLINLYFAGHGLLDLAFSMLILILIAAFVFIPGYVMACHVRGLTPLEQFCSSWVFSICILFLIGFATRCFHDDLSYIYILFVIVCGIVFINKRLYTRLVHIPIMYVLAPVLCACLLLSVSILYSSGPNGFCETTGFDFQADYLMQYNASQMFYYRLSHKSDLVSVWLWGFHLADRTQLLPLSVLPLLVCFGNAFKVFEMYILFLMSLFPITAMLLSRKWFDESSSRLTGFATAILPIVLISVIWFPYRIASCSLLLLAFYFCSTSASTRRCDHPWLAGLCASAAYLVHPNAGPWALGVIALAVLTPQPLMGRILSGCIIAGLTGLAFLGWNLWSKLYDQPSVLYLFPLCINGWGEISLGKEVLLRQFSEAPYSVIIGNRLSNVWSMIWIWYERKNWCDLGAPFWCTLTGGIGLLLAGFAYWNFFQKRAALKIQLLCSVLFPTIIQVIMTGWYEKVFGIYVFPSIMIFVLCGADAISRLKPCYIKTCIILMIAESIWTVWAAWLKIYQCHISAELLATCLSLSAVGYGMALYVFWTDHGSARLISPPTGDPAVQPHVA